LKKLGKYEVLGELGHGAMGVVYRARDPIINRLVALKTITTGVADDPEMLQRFYREAQSAGGLQHPNIVTIYDMGEAGNLPYIAMELVEGENLEQVVARRSALPITLKLVYAMQACRAFDYAHKRGIVHRDIKPGNVMLSKDGVVKVVDFGIARVLENSRTQTGMLIGTFAYMSPEQYHGEHANERSDIWSFGVLVYELLCYQRPFIGPTPASLMHNICDEEPLPLNNLLPECPAALASVVSRMLRKSPADRYQSMEDVLLDLDPVCKTLQAESIAELVCQTRQFFAERRFAEGLDLVRQALQLDSTNQDARTLLEKANLELKRILNRPKAQHFVEKGQALLSEGKFQEAKIAAESALHLDSSFVPAEDLQRAIQIEIDRARQLSEWLDAARQNLAEGFPDEAETVLAKLLLAEPSNPQALALQQQVLKEKAERERVRRLHDGLQHARSLWTRLEFEPCLRLLYDLEKEFPAEEEVSRLLETVREDQLEHQKQQGLLESRNLFAAGHHQSAISLLSDLQNQFPNDEEIPGLLDDVRKDQHNQRRLLALAEARSLLDAGRYDRCIALLNELNATFPGDEEIPKLLDSARQSQAEQVRQRAVTEAGKLFSARQYNDCLTFLMTLEKQFPGDREILALQNAVRQEQAEHEKQQGLEEARSLLTARRYDECFAVLAALQNRFPADNEILRLQKAVREEQIKQRKLQGLEQARNFTACKNYEKAIELLASLQHEFPKNDEIRKLLESIHKEQTDQRRLEGLAQARDLLASRHYDDSINLLIQLQSQFSGDASVVKLLDSARREQAKQRQSEGVAQARALRAARNYDEAIALLTNLQSAFPGESEIANLLATAREDLAEQQKQQRLADARSLLAAQSFVDALALLDPLVAAHPKDSAVSKLRSLVQREQEKHDKAERIQRESDALKKLMGDKKYPEVIARTKELLADFPDEPNFARLAEFAATRQARIEKELFFQQKLIEAKASFDASRFEETMRLVQNALKAFPANAELQHLYEQAEVQQKRIQVRRQIEQRIREIRVKINREELSEAVDLARQTLITLGPDTDVTHLLNSAQVELLARDKKRLQEGTLETIRTLIESGNLDDASRTIDEVVDAQTIDCFDPRVQRLAEQIKHTKAAPPAQSVQPTQSPARPGLANEYAFLQGPPIPDAPPCPEKTPPCDSVTAATQFSASITALPQPIAPFKPAGLVPSVPDLNVPQALPEIPMDQTESAPVPSSLPPGQIDIQSADLPATPPIPKRERIQAPEPSTPLWRKPAFLAISSVAVLLAVWFGLRFESVKPGLISIKTSKPARPPVRPTVDPLEVQQRQALESSNNKVAANDLDGAIQQLQNAAALNGPLTYDIQNKLRELDESKKDVALRQLRQSEEVLWQHALGRLNEKRYADAQKDLSRILALPAGSVHKAEAQRYLDTALPRFKLEANLLAEAQQNLKQADFASARRATERLSQTVGQNGGDPISPSQVSAMSDQIDQAELVQLKQLESQFDQLKLRDDEPAIQQLRALQPKLQALANDGGPHSNEALTFANNIAGAISEIRSRADKRAADTAFQQAVQRYKQAATYNDKTGLTAVRGEFQSIAQASGPHAPEAQKFLNELNDKLAALNQPPPPPPLKPATELRSSAPAVDPSVPVRNAIQRYASAFNHLDADALRQVWPGMGSQYARYKTLFQEVSSIDMQVQIQKIQLAADNSTATVDALESQESRMKGFKPGRKQTPRIFSLSRVNGDWIITDVQ